MCQVSSFVVHGLMLLALCVSTQADTTCYVCNSASYSSCGENNFNYVSNLLNVQDGCEYCTKSVVRAAGSDVTTRSCAAVCVPVNLGALGFGTEVACCDSALCNGATNNRAVGFLVAIVTSLILFLF